MTTLNQVAELFSHWRSIREKRSHTPPRLIAQAISLVGQYKKSQITEQLGINNKMLGRWIKDSEPSNNNAFIELSPKSAITKRSCSLTASAELSSGTTLMLAGESDQIGELVFALRQGSIL